MSRQNASDYASNDHDESAKKAVPWQPMDDSHRRERRCYLVKTIRIPPERWTGQEEEERRSSQDASHHPGSEFRQPTEAW